jgi:hypothetical protein
MLATMLAAGTMLGGCSFSPVYSGALASQQSLSLAYAKPNSRLEQVVYQELALRLGSTDSQTAPLVAVSLTPVISDLVLSDTDNPNKPMEVAVTAVLTITPRDAAGGPPQTYTRRATANYNGNTQVLAERSAQEEALERAAKAVAESLRLAVLAGLSR